MERAQTMPTESPASSSSPTASLVRPADIFKRMREEQQGRQPSPAAPSTDERASVSSAVPESPENTVRPSAQAPEPIHEAKAADIEKSVNPPAGSNEPPSLSLPDVKRLSAFGSGFFGEPESDPQSNQEPRAQPHQLQHSPSLGFRSAVNQAFDVPETPSTIADSVARSNSDSTAGISPIIPRGGTTDDKTPTIHEEPNENTETPTEGNTVFKPGHRRDLSIPSPGNSPSRRPVIAGPDASASFELAQISSGTPAEAPLAAQPQQPVFNPDIPQPSRETTRDDLPAPLNVQTNVAPGPAVSTDIPVIIPAMSTENSPEDTENDRLRKEIIRSLSRENSPSDHQDSGTLPHTSGQNSLFAREYDAYRAAPPIASPSGPEASRATFDPILATSEAPSTSPPPQVSQPKLKKRFSWEESSEDEDPTPVTQAQPARPPPMPGQFPLSQDSVLPEPMVAPTNHPLETADPLAERVEPNTPEKPKLTVIPPAAMDATNIPSTETLARAEEGESFSPMPRPLEQPAHIPPASGEAGLLGFKDILSMQSPYERIQSFDRTRDQFAAIDTGLSNWLQLTFHAHPEHDDVINRNSKPLSEEFRNNVPRAKFPKLASLGNLASSLQDGSHSTSGHIRRPSAPLGSMRQQSGKDFLHTAGVLGGQAVRPRTRVLITWALSRAVEEMRKVSMPKPFNFSLQSFTGISGQGDVQSCVPILPALPQPSSVSSLGVLREVIQTAPAHHNGCPISTPELLSSLSPKHDWSRRPDQISSSRDPASHRILSSLMEKLKNVGRFRRIMGANQSEFKIAQPLKKPLNRLSGLFSRTQHRKSAPPEPINESPSEGSTSHYLAPVTSQPDSRIASSSISSADRHERLLSLPDGRNTIHGSRAPVEGYFAHESPESISVPSPYQHLRGTPSSDRIRLSDPTPMDPGRLSPHFPPYHPPVSPHRHPHVSSPRYSPSLPSPAPRTPPSRGRSDERTYAEDLHLRSRSPKAFAPRPEERNLPKHDPTDPAFNLGAFRSSNPRTSRIGDQELPWKITIPGSDDDEPATDTLVSWRHETEGVLSGTGTRLPTYQEDEEEHGPSQYQPQDEKQGPPIPHPPTAFEPTPPQAQPNTTSCDHPHRSGARTINVFNSPVELPVRTDDNSSEEIMMSSTAYPGQEWRPLGFSEWEHQ
ncbi:hypothetical protein BDW75DRAFT_231540 [Aspergillus navahoensis]